MTFFSRITEAIKCKYSFAAIVVNHIIEAIINVDCVLMSRTPYELSRERKYCDSYSLIQVCKFLIKLIGIIELGIEDN